MHGSFAMHHREVCRVPPPTPACSAGFGKVSAPAPCNEVGSLKHHKSCWQGGGGGVVVVVQRLLFHRGASCRPLLRAQDKAGRHRARLVCCSGCLLVH